MDVHVVVVDNGDIEPELWAFSSRDKADQFGAVRGGITQSLSVIVSNREADKLIFDERIRRS